MLTAAGIILKLIFSRIAKFAAFVIEHWRVFLPAVMVCLALWHVSGLRSERDDALTKLVNYQAQVEDAKRQRRILNLVIEHRLALELAKVDAVHEAQTTTLMENYNAALKDKSAAVATAADLRRRLRDDLQTATATRLPGDRAGSVGLTEVRRDCHAADPGHDVEAYLDTLEYAAADTTLNYNTLWLKCDAAIRAANGTQ